MSLRRKDFLHFLVCSFANFVLQDVASRYERNQLLTKAYHPLHATRPQHARSRFVLKGSQAPHGEALGKGFSACAAPTTPAGQCRRTFNRRFRRSGRQHNHERYTAPAACRDRPRELVPSALPSIAAEIHVSNRSEEHTSELQSQSNLVCR